MLVVGKRLDTVSLDFAKAFDKVDHEILLEKVKITHKISKKKRKMDKRIFNRQEIQSEEGDVLLGLPQGTVLAAILFCNNDLRY